MKELEDFVRQYLIDNNIPLIAPRSKRSVVDLIVYGRRNSGWSTNAAALFAKRYFLNKPKNGKILTHIYEQEHKRVCETCNTLLKFDEFYPNSSKTLGISGNCKKCSRKNSALRRATKLKRTPIWADMYEIEEIYSNCPEGHHVDHIIPLHGERVSGLHVPENLQYLSASENLSKGNKFQIE